jgi:ankyrin repeat protein
MQKRKLSGIKENAGTTSGPDIAGKKLKTENARPDAEKLEGLNMRLLEAAKKGKTEKAVRLLEAGADPNARNSDGRTPLMLASYTGHTEICKLLLEHKADINAVDNYDMTALMLAMARDQTGTIDLLRNYGRGTG